ncbi:hypothetical protein [Adhaeretor mobilis]|uniref:Uncharacterized protein n=1 Tax=Adhaeretor mobilis TaxID=1930276 RepID=A0A517MRH0_9BACT|nr:hypothetical protein [Adhaeretor mobilis]QDS97481.1 hypothetical protein HG15A2_07420 [Adhaeretor mobilis]
MLWTTLVGGLLLTLLILGAVVFAGSKSVISMGNVSLTALPDNIASGYFLPLKSGGLIDPLLVKSLGFEPVGAYDMAGGPAPTLIVAWRKPEEDTFFCVYQVADQKVTDYITLSQDGMLTTGSNKGGQLLPVKEGHYIQTFETVAITELWRKHEGALKLLAQRAAFTPRTPSGKFPDILERSVREQVAAVKELPMWPAYMPYWFFVRQNMRHDKSIKKLYPELS